MYQLDRIEAKLNRLLYYAGATLASEVILMSIAEDELARIAKQTTTIDGIKALLDTFVQAGNITPEQAAAINAAFDANDSKLAAIEAALQPAAPTP